MASNSQLPRIELNQDDTINLEINVYGFDVGTPIELSGQVTQENGAVASFYSVQVIPAHSGESAALWVKAIRAVPPKEFIPDFPITVVARATEAWITTLEPDTGSGTLQSRATPAGSSTLKAAWKSNYYNPAVSPPPKNSGTLLRHGTWWDRVKRDPLDGVMGRFTRLFPYLPGARFDQTDLKRLADEMTAPPEPESPLGAEQDPEENPGIPAAYGDGEGEGLDLPDVVLQPAVGVEAGLGRWPRFIVV